MARTPGHGRVAAQRVRSRRALERIGPGPRWLRARGGDRESVRHSRAEVSATGLCAGHPVLPPARPTPTIVVQETFLRAWRALDRFDESRPFAPWLFRIAANWALTQLETRRRRRGAEEIGDDMAWTGPSPHEADGVRRVSANELNRAVADLPQEQRTVLHLRVAEGLSYREIADTMDLPIGTVMSRLARARETLRRKVER